MILTPLRRVLVSYLVEFLSFSLSHVLYNWNELMDLGEAYYRDKVSLSYFIRKYIISTGLNTDGINLLDHFVNVVSVRFLYYKVTVFFPFHTLFIKSELLCPDKEKIMNLHFL